ncbi:MAG: hypothetical protein ACYCPS_01100 [Candidatus Saccharimonadales bacterium]
MKQTNAPKLTPSPSTKGKSRAVADKYSATSTFISMVLDMSWRLAIVVLVPIISGAELDSHLKQGYVYLLIGFFVALVLAVLVVFRSYKEANSLTRNIGRKK